ncbi:MAG: non-heme iron oxygenase ferredoxin subunit [Chloroflexi bacterium]|nr:non-heme iron oxygenase ferredoxin subunit [Chloroflexota bacterium]
MELLRLSTTKEVPPGEMHQFKIKGKELLVVNIDNHFYCLEARCTHAGAPLTEGTLDGDVLTCPWHGSRFRVTDGSIVGGPASKPLNTYKITIKDDQLFVEA